MSDVEAVPWNGFTVASLFSGCGGSCLGMRMAGFRVVYANEFIAAARETYRSNHPGVPLDPADVRSVTARSIRAQAETALDSIGATGIDVLEGSPPCASFSTAGKLADGWGRVKPYSDTEQRTDDLFFEYARILGELQPKVFVAENVSGLVKGVAKGYFLDILEALQAKGYRVRTQLLNAKWLGVPQNRQRLIFVGVRNDLNAEPAFPRPFGYFYTLADALPWLVAVEGANGFNQHRYSSAHREAATLQATRTLRVEAETDISKYAIGREWDKLAPGTWSDKYRQLSRPSLHQSAPTITFGSGAAGGAVVTHPTERRLFTASELKAISSFPDDFVLTGTYAQQWERVARAVPPLMMRAVAATIRDKVLHGN
jgi:DNA (cytosine-5)-methyltransferase 1